MSQTGFSSSFGPGLLVAKGLAVGAQPIIFGALQDVQLTFDGKIEMLMGQNQWPLDGAVGTRSLKGTAKIGQVSLPLFQLLFGGTASVGTTSIAYAEAHSIPATPFQVTVTNAATFVSDQGVVYTATGIPLQPVVSGPVTGQYSVSSGGIYTFAAADTLLAVQISYTYTSASTGGTLVVPNSLQGTQTTFGILQQAGRSGISARLLLPNCISGKLTLPTAMGKFATSSFDFEAFSAGGTASPFTVYTDI